MRYVFVINPVAGKGRYQQTVLPMIESYFSGKENDYKIIITKAAGEAKMLARAEAEMGDKVTFFACGGEGTCLEVLNGIVGYDNAVLGVIPCGSANDFLKFFKDRQAFLNMEDQISGSAVPVDLIKVGDMYSINQCSVGMDAMVANDMQLFKRIPLVSGSLAYNLSVVKTFFSKMGNRIKIKIDGELLGEKDCLFAVCANGPVYGGGYISAPDAVPFDGKLDYVIVDTISRFKILKFLSTYKSGKHAGLPFCKTGSCRTMEIISKKPIPVNLDGEITLRKSAKFEIVDRKINFLLPKSVADRCLKRELLTN